MEERKSYIIETLNGTFDSYFTGKSDEEILKMKQRFLSFEVSINFIKKICLWHHKKHLTDIIDFDEFISEVIAEYLSSKYPLKYAVLNIKRKFIKDMLNRRFLKRNLTILTCGTLNNFENIMPKKVTKFLDSIEERYKKAESRRMKHFYHQKLIDIVTDLYDSY